MKQIIKNFLFKKRFFKKGIKVLKNKKGFSLMEILVAVALIGIIATIAIPQYTANRKQAAQIAGSTSMTNIQKAYDACRVLKGFTGCNTLGAIGITCPDCASTTNNTDKFCAHIKKGGTATTPDFSACFSLHIQTNGTTEIKRTFGGSFLTDSKICQETECQTGGSTSCAAWYPQKPTSSLKNCTTDTDCGSPNAAGTLKQAGDKYYKCTTRPTTWTGTCNAHACN